MHLIQQFVKIHHLTVRDLHLYHITIHLFLQPIYPILDKLNINTSNLNDKLLDVIFLKKLLSEVSCVLTDNNISINLEKKGGHGRR